MPTPAYVAALREVWGQRLLFLPGVSAAVFTPDSRRILLARRSDTGEWTLPAGIVEPDEHPVACVLRELAEETGVTATVDRLALLTTEPPMAYVNGDRCQFLAMTFRCTYAGGEARVADEESVDVAWFDVDALPPLPARDRRRIECAADPDGTPVLDA